MQSCTVFQFSVAKSPLSCNLRNKFLHNAWSSLAEFLKNEIKHRALFSQNQPLQLVLPELRETLVL